MRAATALLAIVGLLYLVAAGAERDEPRVDFSVKQVSNDGQALSSLRFTDGFQGFIAKDQKGFDWLVARDTLLTNADLASAQAIYTRYDELEPYAWKLELRFTDSGAEKLGGITRRLMNKQLGIFIDGNLVFAATIRARVDGGRLEFEIPNRSHEELQSIARRLVQR